MQYRLSKYIVPSIISMVVVGTNANIDGFFIGRLLGDAGLAAINIAWPIVAFIASLGTGIGVGGSVIMNRVRGEGDSISAESIKKTILVLLWLVGIMVGGVLYLNCKPLLIMMGAEADVLTHAEAYSRVISAGAVFQIVGAGILVLLRNDHRTYQSMIYSVLGLVLHIALNLALAENMVMVGVAMATVISQGVITVLGCFSLSLDKTAKPKAEFVPVIMADTAAPFGINFVPSLVLLFTNFFALRYGDTAAVSAYAAMSYAVYTFDYIFQGICDGIQPIVSFCRGAGERKEELRAVKVSGAILFVFSLCCIGMTPLLIRYLPRILGVSEEAYHMMQMGFWFYALSYPFKAAVKFICSYYYAVGSRGLSNTLVYLEPLLFTPGFLFLLTRWMQVDGVWLAMPMTQVVLTGIGMAVIYGKEKNKTKIY